jgi:hypothetical protein
LETSSRDDATGALLKKLLAVAVLVGLLLVVDLTAKVYAQSQLQQAVNEHAGSDVQAKATISSFPFLGRLMFQQRVDQVHLHVTDFAIDKFTFASVDVNLHGVHIDRNRLFKDQEVRVTEIDHGTATAEITTEELSAAVGAKVEITAGGVVFDVLGKSVKADVQVRDNRLTLQVAGLSLPAVTVPRTSLLPCIDNLQVLDGRLHFSCSLNGVPPAILDLINGAAARSGS